MKFTGKKMELSSENESEDDEEEVSSNEEVSEIESESEEEVISESEEESEENESSENNSEEDELDENIEESTDTEEDTDKTKKSHKKSKSKSKKTRASSKKEKESKKEADKTLQESVEDLESKIFTEEVQMANEISNRYAVETLTHHIPIKAEDQKKIFFNWICESSVQTKDINFEEWQNSHSAREAYFFGPDNVIEFFYS